MLKFLIISLMMMLFKGHRFIFCMIGLEMGTLGMIIYNMSMLAPVGFMLLLIFGVCSSVISLIMVVSLLHTYGQEYTKL